MATPTRKPLQFIEDDRLGIMAVRNPELDVFMHPIEYSQLAAMLLATAPARVLEWGSGGSTAALLALSPFVETWVSLEHNAEWARRVGEMVTDPRLTLKFVPPSVAEPVISSRTTVRERRVILKEWFERCEREPAVMYDYVQMPGTLYSSYDFILVDGRARNRCMLEGYRLLRPGGVMVVHDAQRPEYLHTIASFEHYRFLEPWVQGQLAIIRKP
jgi:hypothetical protein